MESVVQSQTDTVVTTDVITTNVVHTNTEKIIEQGLNSVIVVHNNTGNILTEVPSTNVVVTGLLGPIGPSSEDLDVYSKRVDFISESVLYKGEATVGSLENLAVWRIRKVTIGVDGDVAEIWADGNANFDKQWTQRLVLSYS